MAVKNILCAALVAMLLASCGGGGSDSGDSACASGAFAVTTTWSVTGGAYNPAPYGDQIVVGKVGVPLSAKPVHTGIPESCVGKGTYALGNAAFPLPAGLSLNASTGEISGTPTAAGDVTGGGTDMGAVRLTLPGFSSIRVLMRVLVDR